MVGERIAWRAYRGVAPGTWLLRAHVGRSSPPHRHTNADVRLAVVVAAQMSDAGGKRTLKPQRLQADHVRERRSRNADPDH